MFLWPFLAQDSYSIPNIHILFFGDSLKATCSPYFCIIKTTQDIAAEMTNKVLENSILNYFFTFKTKKEMKNLNEFDALALSSEELLDTTGGESFWSHAAAFGAGLVDGVAAVATVVAVIIML